jgi:hypothetical protein
MQLKTFNRHNAKGRSTIDPQVTINGKTGSFYLNYAACMLMEIGPSTKVFIEFHQDEKKPLDWYMELTDAQGTGIACHKRATTDKGQHFSNKWLMQHILEQLNLPKEEMFKFKVGKKDLDLVPGMKLWPLITKPVIDNWNKMGEL